MLFVLAFNLECVQKISEESVRRTGQPEFSGLAAAVRESGDGCTMVEADPCDGIQGDKRTTVVVAVEVRTFHQCALRIQVAYFQVCADRSV